jgi:hypothetical protein
MKINSRNFLKQIQECIQKDNMSILDTIIAIQEKNNIHFDDVIEMMKQEKTLMKELQTECIKENKLRNHTLSADISDIFK